MKNNRFVAIALAATLASSAVPTSVFAQQSTSLAGTAKDEAKKPYPNYSVRARDVAAGTQSAPQRLDGSGNFSITGLTSSSYLIELLNNGGKVVCTQGPFDLSQNPIKSDIVIDCNNKKVPAAVWLLGAAAAAGITAAVVTTGDTPAAPVAVQQSAPPASPSR